MTGVTSTFHPVILGLSSAGSTEQTLIGCRQVSYFKPLRIAVLNTTVIFEDYEHQKNLDPLQKLTGDYINMQGEGVPPPPGVRRVVWVCCDSHRA